jgi:hypothetical protein
MAAKAHALDAVSAAQAYREAQAESEAKEGCGKAKGCRPVTTKHPLWVRLYATVMTVVAIGFFVVWLIVGLGPEIRVISQFFR